MKKSVLVMWVVTFSFLGLSDEMTGTLKNTHRGVDQLSRQLSNALDGLSHGLGNYNRPISNEDIDEKAVLNGLNQLSLDPSRDPNENFDSLIKQEAKLRKELVDLVNGWLNNDARESTEKETVGKVLSDQREVVRKKHGEVLNKIKDQIDLVMRKSGYAQLEPGSSTYKRGSSWLRVVYREGKIQTEAIKALPPTE